MSEPTQQPAGPQPQMPGAIPPGYQLQPVKKKKWPWIVGGIVLIFILMIGGCMAVVGKAVDEVDKEMKSTASVVYEVTKNGQPGVAVDNASITYTNGDSNISQDTAASLPWTKTVDVTGLGKYVSLTATNDENGGAITCTIRQGEKVISTNTAVAARSRRHPARAARRATPSSYLSAGAASGSPWATRVVVILPPVRRW